MQKSPTSSEEEQQPPQRIVNDFTITIGTRNGSGSATSNLTLLRAIFRMGVPVSGKNLFPSNIQGQPTWYTIRVSKDGFLARRAEHEIVVAMNSDSFVQDIQQLVPNGVLFYDQDIGIPIERKDIITYEMPVKQLIKQVNVPSGLKSYAANMVYVGIVAQMLGIDLAKIRKAVEFHFKGKTSAIELNYGIIQAAAEWAAEHLEKKDPYFIEPMSKTEGYILAEGNTAAALGALFGGVQFVSWYPITPASTLAEELSYYLPRLRKDPVSGKNTCAVIQAEDEIAAVGMAIGAGWAGLRAMTSTSGPGLSLMAEFIGLAYYTEVPLVVWDIARVGPSTGLPTRTSQGDLTFIYFLGHGDTDNIILLPHDPHECFEFGWRAFDYAERFQTPIIVMSDLDLGMQYWMTKPFEYPNQPMDRGKVLWEKDLEELKSQWGRYLDVDGDGIPYRTVPGNRHPAAPYMNRGTGHNEYARYTESDVVWERMLNRIKKKIEGSRPFLPPPIINEMGKGNKIGIITFGTAHAAVEEARHQLYTEKGIASDYMRIRAVPFHPLVNEFIQQHEKNYVVELNRDGQMYQLLIIDMPQHANKLFSVCHIDGLPLTAAWVKNAILNKENQL